MSASLICVGENNFRSALQTLIHDSATFTVEVAANPFEAMRLVQVQQPDLVLIQAQQQGGIELCEQIKIQHRLAWIYCIVIEDRPPNDSHIQALEKGADAYLKLDLQHPNSSSTRLLLAQMQIGLRQVLAYQNLMRENNLLSSIALSDPLTNLSNRRSLEWELPRVIANARARKQPISLVIIDVDFFKIINDTHGHLVGDRALEILATRLQHNLRLYDTPYRYGGEEFVIILSDTHSIEGEAIANRICQLIREQPFVVNSDLALNVTISAGTATLQPHDDADGLSLLERADQRLLRAKTAGRDRVIGGD
ncbi:MAG: diguanylate cyclase [Timaviella obliquedivisa GSE-PSE-MK23-08B]|jgi:two-component system cell cycle response regulator|nr:diguanylate cyclase [Timaviella obliquedivisa GSE-PSE-MK23-08B]